MERCDCCNIFLINIFLNYLVFFFSGKIPNFNELSHSITEQIFNRQFEPDIPQNKITYTHTIYK